MTHTIIASLAALIYLLTAGLIAWQLFRPENAKPVRTLPLIFGFIGMLLHTWTTWDGILKSASVTLSMLQILSLTSWTVVALLLSSSLTRPVATLGIVAFPVAALTLIGEAAWGHFSTTATTTLQLDWPSRIHVLISMLSYSLITLAAIQALLLLAQEIQLHRRKPGGFLRALPPLQTMETILFEMITVGFILLTLSLISSYAAYGNLFAPKLMQQSVMSILAWIVFATLLIGRFLRGWRGRVVITWTLGGFGLLMFAFLLSATFIQTSGMPIFQ